MPARTSRRSALPALGLVLLLLAPLVPSTLAQGGIIPQPSVQDIYLVPGEVTFTRNGVTTQFLSDGPLQVTARVHHVGSTQVTVPIFFWVLDHQGEHVTSIKKHCRLVTLPASPSNSEPSTTPVTWSGTDVEIPKALPSRGYNVTVAVNPPASLREDPDLDWPFSETECSNDTQGSVDRANPETNQNNLARGYFVKDKRVDYKVSEIVWCSGKPDLAGYAEPHCTDPGLVMNNGHAWNTTAPRPDEGDYDTHFRLEAENVGEWRDTIDYGGCLPGDLPSECPNFNWTARFTVTGGNRSENLDLTLGKPIHTRNATAEFQRSGVFSMVDRAGEYRVAALLNANGKFADNGSANNAIDAWFNVSYLDLGVAIDDDWNTTRENPYPYAVNKRLNGTFFFTNNGTAWRNGTVTVTVDFDGREYGGAEPCYFCHQWTFDEVSPGWTMTQVYDKPFSMSTSDNNYLSPGLHHFRVTIAEADYYDPNSTNDVLEFDVYVQDGNKPRFVDAPRFRQGSYANGHVVATRAYEMQPFNLYVGLDDEDISNVDLIANFSLKENNTTYQTFELEWLGPDIGTRWSVPLDGFPIVGNGTSSNWTLNLTAKDAFANVAYYPTPVNLRIERWPIQTLPESRIVLPQSTANETAFAWDGLGNPEFWIEVHYNQTGVRNPNSANDVFPPENPPDPDQSKYQHNSTANLGYSIQFADGTNETRWGAEARWTARTCYTQTGQPQDETTCANNMVPENIGKFNLTIDKVSHPKAGRWNVSLLIKDHAGAVRAINRTVLIVDALPTIKETWLSRSAVPAGGSDRTFTVAVNASDDILVKAAYANFTRTSDGKWFNYTLPTAGWTDAQGKQTNYSVTLAAGRGRAFGEAGTYNVRFVAVDANNNWNSVLVSEAFRLIDGARPVLDASQTGATPQLQETFQNVTFYARGDDETNVTFIANVTRGGGDLVASLVLEPQLDGNSTAQLNFSQEGTYGFSIVAIDSGGLSSMTTVQGILNVRNNLGPRVEVLRPLHVIDGVRYGQGTQRIEVQVYDSDGVAEGTLSFTVDGEPVQFDKVAAQGVRGYVLTHQVPAGKRYLHGAVVTVNVSAKDLSDSQLLNWANFSFTVDDVAPSARFEGFEPRYRASDLDPWIVSPDTLYALTASDDDSLPTRVESLRYKVFGPSLASLEQVYGGPFRLTDAFGEDLRPGNYVVQFWGEDTVGNVNRTPQTLTVYVDNTPPSRDPYGAEPKDRFVNLTVVDDRAGVNRVVLWHRINNGSWGQTSMTFSGEVWRAVLPEARKSDRIRWYVQAWDNVNNTATVLGDATVPQTYDVPNHKPTLRVTAPLVGDTIGLRRDFAWEALDADGDPLAIELSLRSPGAAGFTELARYELSDPRKHSFDSTKYSDGDYTLRVRASDGFEGATVEVSFSISNSGSALGEVKANKTALDPGERTLLTAKVTKASTTAVEARVYRGESFVTSYRMVDDGKDGDAIANDGVYSALVSFDGAGDYRVDVYTKYREAGLEKEATYTNVASFSVALTPGYIAQSYWPLLALVGVAGAAAIGLAGWKLARRR